jgi:tRNA A37 threonylcarbamoyladenosine dehydratase
MKTDRIFRRLEALVGESALERLRRARVALFGAGGVGSWCAEALVRNGIGNLTVMDSDLVCETDINRQLQATWSTLGMPKVKALTAHLADINPDAEITGHFESWNPRSSETFDLGAHDYIVDAIDSLGAKVDLIARTLAGDNILFSSLGASRKLDPTRVRVDSFWDVEGCPLGKHMRKRLRNRGATKNFLCVYSNENLPGRSSEMTDVQDDLEQRNNGSAVHVTAVFGLVLAGLVVQDIVEKQE